MLGRVPTAVGVNAALTLRKNIKILNIYVFNFYTREFYVTLSYASFFLQSSAVILTRSERATQRGIVFPQVIPNEIHYHLQG